MSNRGVEMKQNEIKERLLREIIDESDEISKILYSIVKTSKS